MSKTLNFTSSNPVPAERIDRYVYRRRTPQGYDRLREMARDDFARQVAWEVSPGQRRPGMPTMCFASAAPQPCANCLSPADCARTTPTCFR